MRGIKGIVHSRVILRSFSSCSKTLVCAETSLKACYKACESNSFLYWLRVKEGSDLITAIKWSLTCWIEDVSLRVVSSSYSSMDLGLNSLIACERNSLDSWLSGIRDSWLRAIFFWASCRIDLVVDVLHGLAVIVTCNLCNSLAGGMSGCVKASLFSPLLSECRMMIMRWVGFCVFYGAAGASHCIVSG